MKVWKRNAVVAAIVLFVCVAVYLNWSYQSGEAIQTLASYTVSEAQIENLVTAKGYTDCVAFIGDESVSVVVSAREGGLTDADVAKITEIVTDETGMEASQVKIIEAE